MFRLIRALVATISFASLAQTAHGEITPPAKAPNLIICPSSGGSVLLDLAGDNPRVAIPSTHWPRKGDGWYKLVNLVDEATVLSGQVDLGGAKAAFSLDKYTGAVNISKGDGLLDIARTLNFSAKCSTNP
jgi:hypothetical protein